METAIVSAHAALRAWRRVSMQERRRILLKAARLLEERATEFVEVWRREMHVSQAFAEFNAITSVGMLEEIASLVSSALAGEIPSASNGERRDCLRGSRVYLILLLFSWTALSRIGQDVCTLVTREPYGVCLAIAPWNAAMILSIRAIATPLAAGNTVILRSSEVVPGTHYLWGKLFADAGLPAGCLNILHAGRTNAPGVTKRLIEDSRVRHVNFVSVSSTRAAFQIFQLIAKLIDRLISCF